MATVAEKRAAFKPLHENGCFVIPNPWDVGSAAYLQHMGFKALATTSAGFAWSLGKGDGGVTRDMALAHFAELSAAADVPMNADFESGFADAERALNDDVARRLGPSLRNRCAFGGRRFVGHWSLSLVSPRGLRNLR